MLSLTQTIGSTPYEYLQQRPMPFQTSFEPSSSDSRTLQQERGAVRLVDRNCAEDRSSRSLSWGPSSKDMDGYQPDACAEGRGSSRPSQKTTHERQATMKRNSAQLGVLNQQPLISGSSEKFSSTSQCSKSTTSLRDCERRPVFSTLNSLRRTESVSSASSQTTDASELSFTGSTMSKLSFWKESIKKWGFKKLPEKVETESKTQRKLNRKKSASVIDVVDSGAELISQNAGQSLWEKYRRSKGCSLVPDFTLHYRSEQSSSNKLDRSDTRLRCLQKQLFPVSKPTLCQYPTQGLLPTFI
ncbi:hypothetical protein BDZ91DRAFT_790568 [Kalaharituber pfeilii]|nr:hypothetical protein BDZ91DRAFT_790568 [Kalaharituber pfeilii]